MSAAQHKIAAFRSWAQTHPLGSVFVYYREPLERDPDAFAYARKLHDAGLVFLFQRRLDNGMFEHCARRCAIKDHKVLDVVSASIQVNPSRQAA
jgi:hypothetical protein